MNAPLPIPNSLPIDTVVSLPGSKSLSNRALLCAALASGTSTLTHLLDCDDTRHMVDCLQQLGVDCRVDWTEQRAVIVGTDGRLQAADQELYVGNSGTTIRFLVPALAACGTGEYRLIGQPRMSQRPIRELIQAVNHLGGKAFAETQGQFPPVRLYARGLTGGPVEIDGSESSQFASGLLLAAPYMAAPLDLTITGDLVSKPFVQMTAQVMRHFGVSVEIRNSNIRVSQQKPYQSTELKIEPDATAASYFFAAAAITGGRATILGLGDRTTQGDLKFVNLLGDMGCTVQTLADRTIVQGNTLRGIDCNLKEMSDTVPTLAVVALFASTATTIRGVSHNRLKESDRIGDLARELRRVGASVQELDDGLQIEPAELHGATMETYNDHRMAMSLALIGLRVPGIQIKDPACVSKTFPGYFDQLFKIVRS